MLARFCLVFVFALIWAPTAEAQQPNTADKSQGDELSDEAYEDEKPEVLSSDEIFRRFAPRLLFLDPTYSGELKLPEDLRLEVRMVIKNALKQEGSFRVRTMGDLEIDDEALFGEAKVCKDNACLFQALNHTAIGQFLRTRVSSAPNDGLRVVITGYRVDQRKAYRAADYVVHADPAVGALDEVLLRSLRRQVRLAIFALPPAPMVNGTLPAFDAAIALLAPTGATVKVDGEAAGEVLQLDLLRLERNGGKTYAIQVDLPGHLPAKGEVKLRPGQAAVIELLPQRSEDKKRRQPRQKIRVNPCLNSQASVSR